MRQGEIDAVRSFAQGLLRTNLKRGHDLSIGYRYSYLCPSPHDYPWQWFWDSCFHAVVMAHVEPEQATAELKTLVAGQDANGFIGHITFWGNRLWGLTNLAGYAQSRPGERLRHSALIQPPMLAQAVERVAEVVGDPALAPQFMDSLDRYHEWLAENRAPDGDGLLVIVSPYESGIDQSPTYDAPLGVTGKAGRLGLGLRDRWLDVRNWMNSYGSTRMLRAAHFYVKDALVNALYAESLETMARLHRAQMNPASAKTYAQRAELVTASLVEKLLDRTSGAFYSLIGKEELRSEPLTVGGLMPLVIGGLPRDVAGELVDRHLRNRNQFWTRYPVPSVAASEPSFNPRSASLIWRGPTWVNTNWLLWRGLRRHGFDELAAQLAARTITMVAEAGLREFYNPLNGEGNGARSFGWSALALDMAEG